MADLPAGLVPKILSFRGACAYMGSLPARDMHDLVKHGYVRPLLGNRFLIADLDAAIDSLRLMRDNPPDKELNGSRENGRTVHGEGEVCSGAERPGLRLRPDSGGSAGGCGPEGGGEESGAEPAVYQYPDLPGLE